MNNKEITIKNIFMNRGKRNLFKISINKVGYKKILSISSLLKESYKNFEYVGETIERKAAIISNSLSNGNKELSKYITYIIREIARNVVEHSKSDIMYLECNRCYDDNIIRIIIKDYGIGIKKSLNQNSYFNFEKDSEALVMSVQPGITKAYKRIKKNSNNIWQNSGFGLFMVSSICQQKGSFSITSGSSQLNIINNDVSIISSNFKGTKVELTFYIEDGLQPLSTRLNKLSIVGSKYAKSWNVNTIKTASHSSVFLTNKY